MSHYDDYEGLDRFGSSRRSRRWQGLGDHFEAPAQWLLPALALVISLIALVLTLDTRNRLPTEAGVVIASSTPLAAETIEAIPTPTEPPTAEPLPSATPNPALIVMPVGSGTACQGSVVAPANAIYYDQPSIQHGQQLGIFVPYQRLNILEESNNFYHVSVGGIEGWISMIYIQPDDVTCIRPATN